MKKFITFLSGLCAFVCMVACSSSSSPSGVVEQYAKYVKSGDYEKIIDLIYFDESDPKKAEESRAMVTGVLSEKLSKAIEKNDGVASYEIGTETIAEDGNSGNVELTFTYGNGENDTQKVDVENVDGKWYLELGK